MSLFIGLFNGITLVRKSTSYSRVFCLSLYSSFLTATSICFLFIIFSVNLLSRFSWLERGLVYIVYSDSDLKKITILDQKLKLIESMTQTQIFLSLYLCNPWYFPLILFDLTEFIVWIIQGVRHWVAKIKEL